MIYPFLYCFYLLLKYLYIFILHNFFYFTRVINSFQLWITRLSKKHKYSEKHWVILHRNAFAHSKKKNMIMINCAFYLIGQCLRYKITNVSGNVLGLVCIGSEKLLNGKYQHCRISDFHEYQQYAEIKMLCIFKMKYFSFSLGKNIAICYELLTNW